MQCTFDQIARVMAVYKAKAVANFAMNVNLGTHKLWQNHQIKQLLCSYCVLVWPWKVVKYGTASDA